MTRHERRVIPVAEGGNPARNFRLLRHWTQQDAAKWWGSASERTWRRWESGRVPIAVLKRIQEWVNRSCPENIRYVFYG